MCVCKCVSECVCVCVCKCVSECVSVCVCQCVCMILISDQLIFLCYYIVLLSPTTGTSVGSYS